MPQMMPLYWIFLNIISILLLTLILITIYFFYLPSIPLPPAKFSSPIWLWTW